MDYEKKKLENEFDKDFEFIVKLGLDSQEDYDRIKAGWVRLRLDPRFCNSQNRQIDLCEYLET